MQKNVVLLAANGNVGTTCLHTHTGAHSQHRAGGKMPAPPTVGGGGGHFGNGRELCGQAGWEGLPRIAAVARPSGTVLEPQPRAGGATGLLSSLLQPVPGSDWLCCHPHEPQLL